MKHGCVATDTPTITYLHGLVFVSKDETYIWIGHQKQTQKNCRKTERDRTIPRPRMESSRGGASTGAGIQAPFLFFGKLLLEK